jgi:hypothetical protein
MQTLNLQSLGKNVPTVRRQQLRIKRSIIQGSMNSILKVIFLFERQNMKAEWKRIPEFGVP